MMKSNNAPRYDMARNPCYQVDYKALSSGKYLAVSKRRVSWRFGFSDPDAIARGEAGTNCRGEEHEVSLTWSLASGKREILANGERVHHANGRRAETHFEATWTMRGGNHVLKVVAHASPAVFSNQPDFRQFDLTLDGLSFFDMPKIYELNGNVCPSTAPAAAMGFAQRNPAPVGLPRLVSCHPGMTEHDRSIGYLNELDGECASPEELHYAHAVNVGGDIRYAEHEASGRPVPVRSASVPTDLMSDPITAVGEDGDLLGASSSPSPLPPYVTHHHHHHHEDPSAAHLSASLPQIMTTPDEFTPVAPTAEQQQPQAPSFAAISSQIMSAYGPPSPPPTTTMMTGTAPGGVLALTNSPANVPPSPVYGVGGNAGGGGAASPVVNMETPTKGHNYYHQHQHHHAQSQQQGYPYYHQPSSQSDASIRYYHSVTDETEYEQSVGGVGGTSDKIDDDDAAMNRQLMSPTSVVQTDQPSVLNKALQNLVNLEDITEPADSPEKYQQLTLKRQEIEEKKPKTSKPLPPATTHWNVGSNASLEHIQANKVATTTPKSDDQPVMRTHAFDPAAAQAGMLVVHGSSQPGHQPPMTNPAAYMTGRGAGAYLSFGPPNQQQ